MNAKFHSVRPQSPNSRVNSLKFDRNQLRDSSIHIVSDEELPKDTEAKAEPEAKGCTFVQLTIMLEHIVIILLVSIGLWMLLSMPDGKDRLKEVFVPRSLNGGWIGVTAPILKELSDHDILDCSDELPISQIGKFTCVDNHLFFKANLDL